MVEDDPRFIGLTASAIVAWLKIIRLLDRNSKHRGFPHEIATSWDEMRLHLHVSSDRLLTLMDIFHERGLAGYSHGEFRLPREALQVIISRPAEKRASERFRLEEERRKASAADGDNT
jgi:hypothetical protein